MQRIVQRARIAATLPPRWTCVLANILAGTLVELAPRLRALRATGWAAGPGRHPEAAGARSARRRFAPRARTRRVRRARWLERAVGHASRVTPEHVHDLPQLHAAPRRDGRGPAGGPGLCALRSLRSRVQRAALAGRGTAQEESPPAATAAGTAARRPWLEDHRRSQDHRPEPQNRTSRQTGTAAPVPIRWTHYLTRIIFRVQRDRLQADVKDDREPVAPAPSKPSCSKATAYLQTEEHVDESEVEQQLQQIADRIEARRTGTCPRVAANGRTRCNGGRLRTMNPPTNQWGKGRRGRRHGNFGCRGTRRRCASSATSATRAVGLDRRGSRCWHCCCWLQVVHHSPPRTGVTGPGHSRR